MSLRIAKKGGPVASLRNLSVVILAIALDLYLVKYCLEDESYFPYAGFPIWFRIGFAGSLPMGTSLVIGGFLLISHRASERPFLAGFVVFGALALFAMLGVSLVIPWGWFTTYYRSASNLWWKLYLQDHYTFGLSRKDYLLAAQMVFFTLLFSVPELLVAVTGGAAARSILRPRDNSEVMDGADSTQPNSQ